MVELLEEAYKVDPDAVMAHLTNQHIKPAKRTAICAALGIEEALLGGGAPGVSYSISRATTRDEVRAARAQCRCSRAGDAGARAAPGSRAAGWGPHAAP